MDIVVPDKAAKPIIDMDIVAPDKAAALEVIEGFAPLGYTHWETIRTP